MFSLAEVKTHTPPNMFPAVEQREASGGLTASGAALAGAAVGAAIGAAAMGAKKLDAKEGDQN